MEYRANFAAAVAVVDATATVDYYHYGTMECGNTYMPLRA